MHGVGLHRHMIESLIVSVQGRAARLLILKEPSSQAS